VSAGFCKMLGNFWIAELRSVSQQGLSSMKLVCLCDNCESGCFSN
jgi:hypothetical protein